MNAPTEKPWWMNITPSVPPEKPENLRDGVRIVGMDRAEGGDCAVEAYQMPDGTLYITRVMRSVNGHGKAMGKQQPPTR